MYGQKTGLEAAVAAATKLDASLHAKGKLTKNTPEGLSKCDVLKLIQAEYSINHVPQSTRNLLCKGSTQEIIKDFSGACVSTKGRYIPESERKALNLLDKTSKNLGLYLFIQGPTNRSVDSIQKIEEMISSNAESNNHRTGGSGGISGTPTPGNGPHPANAIGRGPGAGGGGNVPPTLMTRNLQIPPPVMELIGGKFVVKIRVGMDNVLPGFNLPMKLIGQGGSNLNYIKNETGASVTLRGVGSAFIEPATQQESPEPLHFCITHHKPDVIVTARDLALNLIATVQQEYAQFQMQQQAPQNIPAQLQQINVEPPNLMLHQPGNGEHPVIQQPMPNVMSTSIALPVVQTGFIQQPAVTQLTAPPPIVGVPPPHFTQPPPGQVTLPPPGVHIPQQQGPLVPPPASQHLQLQPQHEQPGNFIQQIAQPFQPGQQPGQQYVITQNGQPMQGIMTSQGLVVLNQQTQPTYAQQVFLSQPPPVGPTQPVFQSGQHLALQSPVPGQPLHAAVTAPVSYQFQYVQQNPPPGMAYPTVQNPVQTQPSHIQIQPPQQSQIGPNPPANASSGQSPIQNQQGNQPNLHVSQPPPPMSNHSPQNPPPTQRHSPNVQGPPPPNQPNPAFSVQPNQNPMLLQHNPNHQMIQGNQPIPPIQNQNVQTIPVSNAGFLPGQPQLMHIQGVRPPNEVQAQFQLQQQNYGQYQQQVVMKQIQVCQPQQLQFVPGCPPGPIQILPTNSGQFIPPVHQLPPNQFNQNQEPLQEPKPAKRKFTEELAPSNPQGQTPQSLMSIPLQPPQPVPPPMQPAINNNARQGIGVQELMIMNQHQRRQHLQQPEGIQKDPSQKGEETSVVSPPPPSTGNQKLFQVSDGNQTDGDKMIQQRPFSGCEENQMNRDQVRDKRSVESERDERNCGFNRRDRIRERPSFSHYSSKPQMYDTMIQHPLLGLGMCPPPPPPPPHLMSQPQGGGPHQPPANHFFNNRPY